jgi:HD-GYP domain-containing protein (c-di-GMP phosphodiesterase class II)
MLQKILVNDLKLGMFVADLDRPWMDTPFLLQGFLLETADQISQVKLHCEYVLIDPMRSFGPEYDRIKKAMAKSPPPVKRDLGKDPVVTITRKEAPRAVDPNVLNPALAQTAAKIAAGKAGVSDGNANAQERKSASREFAVNTKTEVQDDGLSATGRFRAEGLLPPRDNIRPSTSSSVGGLWGQFKQDLKGLFARKSDGSQNKKSADLPDYDESIAAPETERPSFIPESVHLTIYEEEQTVEEEMGAASEAFTRSQDLLHRVIDDIRTGNQLQIEVVNQVMEDLVESMVRNPDAMMWVARLREQDTMTYDHGLSVAINLVAFGRHLGFPKDDLAHLGVMGLMLDVGKMRVPRELLEKEEALTPEEFTILKQHVRHSMNILSETANIHSAVIEGVSQHHERMDGSGYPNGMAGQRISVYGRMCGIVDTYAAITKYRPYADPVSPHEALQMLSNWSPSLFQLDMVEQFIQSIGVFPVGSLVELSTGEVAVVVTHNKQRRLKPKILVVTEADKKARKHPSMRDLLYDTSENPVFIRRGLPANAFGIDPSEYYLN